MTVLTDRTLSCIISLSWDREVPNEDERAMACYKELLSQLAREGYHSYRLSVGAMGAMGENSTYQEVLGALKVCLDPKGILAPGRYIPPANSAGASERSESAGRNHTPQTV